MIKLLKRINWTNTLFLTLTPLFGIGGLIFLLGHHGVPWQTWVLALVFTFIGGLGITAGYHRLFSHNTYKAAWPIRLLLLLGGAANFEGSVLEWSTDHRNHHKYTDTPQDPYNIKQGFWHAHIGWLLTLDTSKRNFSNCEDLQKDALVRFQHHFFVPIAIMMGFVLPMLIAASWGDIWGGLLIAGALRITIAQQGTFCINSVCHLFGKQTYSDRNSAVDNWFTALFTFGEGFHNFHHKFPNDYRNGIRYFHFDPTKWLIRGLAYVGLAKDLKRISNSRIIQLRLEHDQKRLAKREKYSLAIRERVTTALQPIYRSTMQALRQIEELEKAYRELQASKADYLRDRVTEYHKRIAEYREKLSQANSELKSLLKEWSFTIKNPILA